MYNSKYYTCEQIDQRLLQGYYDDAVAAGYTGSKAQYLAGLLRAINYSANPTLTADKVVYNTAISGLTSKNVQSAVDEVSSIGHFAKRGGIVNISTNYNSTNTAEVLTLEQAIYKVPSSDRVLGFQGKFLSESGWKTYQFAGTTISDWNNTDYWYTESVNDVITAVGSGILKINTNEGYIQISGYILSDFSSTKIPSQKIAFNFDSTINEFYTIYLDYSNNLKVVKFICADTGEVKKIVCRFNTTKTGKIAIDYSIVPTIDINGTIVSIFDYSLNNVLDSNSNTLNNLVLYKSYEYNYIDGSGVIREYTDFFHVTNLIKVTPSLKIMQACAPNSGGIVGVKYNKNFTQIGLITKSTSELVSDNGAYYFDLVYEDYSDAEYIILNVDDRAHFSISNFVMLDYDYLIRTQKYSYFNEPSNTIEGAGKNSYLYIDSDYNQFTIGLQNCVKLAINSNVIIANQKITISKREDVDIEYYIAYLDEELTLHCTTFKAVITDNAIIIARFTVKKNSEVNISYSRCPIIMVNGSRIRTIVPVDSDIYESGYNYIGKEEVLPYTSNYKVSKLLYVTKNIKITHACQANSNVCAALLYDENLNKIGEVKSTVESPVSSTEFIVDISYDNVKNASYIRFCTNYDKYPSAIYNAKVVSQFHIDNINKRTKVLSHNIYMEEDTKEFELTPEYPNKLYTKYDVFQREVTAVNVLLNKRVDTDILLFNSITNSNTVIQTIKGSTINAGEYNLIILDKPIYIRANQYIGFSRNVSWIHNSHNNVGGSVIASTRNPGTFEQQKSVVFCYGLYYNNPNTNLIRKSISVMGDSISTDNYVTNPEKVYWKRLSNTCDLKRIGKSIQGGTCIMTGLRPNHAVPFTSQTRWSNLFSNGATGDYPDIILIFGGVNDFGTTPADGDVFLKYAELGTMSDIGSDDPSLSFYAAYSYLLRKLIETYPNVQIICCTPIKMWAYEGRLTSYYPLTNIHGLKMEDFVQAIKDCARTYGAQVVDLFNDYPANQTNYLSYHKDVYHPKEEGYAVIEELILNAIKNRL